MCTTIKWRADEGPRCGNGVARAAVLMRAGASAAPLSSRLLENERQPGNTIRTQSEHARTRAAL